MNFLSSVSLYNNMFCPSCIWCHVYYLFLSNNLFLFVFFVFVFIGISVWFLRQGFTNCTMLVKHYALICTPNLTSFCCQYTPFLLSFLLSFLNVYEWFTCMYIYVSRMCLVPREVRRGCQILELELHTVVIYRVASGNGS